MIKTKYLSFLLIAFIFSTALLGQSTLYIAPDGNDQNPGTLALPFATLEKAIAVASSAAKGKTTIPPGVSIFLRGGSYHITKSIKIDSSLSGSKQFPVIIKNYNNETVSINGGVKVPAGHVKEVVDKRILNLLPPKRSKVFEVDLNQAGVLNLGVLRSHGFRRPYYPSAMEVFINKKPMHLARYPNNEMMPLEKIISQGSVPAYGDFRKVDAKFSYENPYYNRWKTATDAWIGGYFTFGFADDEIPLRAIDTINKTIETKGPSLFGFSGGQPHQRWYIYNLIEELDEAGEYYVDRKNGKLYFLPPANEPIASIELSMLETPMISLIGTSYITISGITFENTRGIGIYEEKSEGNNIINCVFQNIGLVGVVVGKGIEPFDELRHSGTGTPASEIIGSWHEHIYDNPEFDREGGFKNGIENCIFKDIGMGAISLGGGNRRTLKSAGNFVEYCEFTNYNRLGSSYKGAVNIDGVGNVVKNCLIYNAPHVAIYIHGNNHFINNNEIHDVCKEANDMGAIYMGGDPSEAGNIISNNYLHNILPKTDGYSVTAVFIDDGAILNEITGNVFYKCGTKNFGAVVINGGGANLVSNNIFIACKAAGTFVSWDSVRWKNYVNGKLWQHRLFKAIDIKKPPYSTVYPAILSIINSPKREAIATKNYLVRCDIAFSMGFRLTNNWATNQTTDFIDYRSQNFSLKNGASPYYKVPGFSSLPFSGMGLKNGSTIGTGSKK